jgi:hypothetical protein
MRPRLAFAAGAAALAVAAGGCGASSSGGSQPAEVSPPGDIPDNQAFVAYSPKGGDYSVKVPEGWARTAAGGTVTFTDKLNAISMREVAARAPLTAARATGTELPRLAATVKGFQAAKVGTVDRHAGRAVRITYLADAKPDPVTGKAGTDAVERYAFFHGGHLVTLTLSGPKGADNVDPWMIVSDSLRWSR